MDLPLNLLCFQVISTGDRLLNVASLGWFPFRSLAHVSLSNLNDTSHALTTSVANASTLHALTRLKSRMKDSPPCFQTDARIFVI